MENNKLYDLVALTSMGLRMTPLNNQPVATSQNFKVQVTSAESNVLTVAASLGYNTKVLTTFVKDSPISSMIKQDLHRRNIAFEGPDKTKGGPWGYRHQINIVSRGFGHRKPVVTNDRSGEVATQVSMNDYDFDQLFNKDGVRILHISGLYAGISEETLKLTINTIKKAKQTNTIVSFDINYRESFWENRKQELKNGFHEIVSHSDILFGNEEDYQKALGIDGPSQLNDFNVKDYKKMLYEIKNNYPNLTHISSTLRDVTHAKQHNWGAITYVDDAYSIITPQPIQVFDRIGGGDGFAGGYLYGILSEKTVEETLQFAWATGAYTVTLEDDFAVVLNENDILQIWNKNARVKR